MKVTFRVRGIETVAMKRSMCVGEKIRVSLSGEGFSSFAIP